MFALARSEASDGGRLTRQFWRCTRESAADACMGAISWASPETGVLAGLLFVAVLGSKGALIRIEKY